MLHNHSYSIIIHKLEHTHTHTQVLGNFLGGKSEMSSELAATLKGRKLFRTIPAFAKHSYADDSSKRIWSQVAKSGHRLRKMYQNTRRGAETELQHSRLKLIESLRSLRETERKTLQSDRTDLATFASKLG